MKANCRIFLLTAFLGTFLFGGFPTGTLVKSGSRYIPIEQLEVGDVVDCFCHEQGYVERAITYKTSRIVTDCVCIILDQETIITSRDQRLYLPDEGVWKEAELLQSGDLLASQSQPTGLINNIFLLKTPIKLFDVAVNDCHNFLITRKAILVHNIFPFVIGLSWAFGAGAAQFTGVSLGTALLGGAIGFKLHRERKEDKWKKTFKINEIELGGGGSPDPNKDDEEDENKTSRVKIFEKNVKHIFRNASGHLLDTTQNRELLIKVASDIKNFLGIDKYGNKWFAKNLSNGKQVWVSVRENLIRNGGLSNCIRIFNKETGLCKP